MLGEMGGACGECKGYGMMLVIVLSGGPSPGCTHIVAEYKT